MKDLQHLILHGYQITVQRYDGKQQCVWDYVSLVQEWSISNLLILEFQENKVQQGFIGKEFSLPAQKQELSCTYAVGKKLIVFAKFVSVQVTEGAWKGCVWLTACDVYILILVKYSPWEVLAYQFYVLY